MGTQGSLDAEVLNRLEKHVGWLGLMVRFEQFVLEADIETNRFPTTIKCAIYKSNVDGPYR